MIFNRITLVICIVSYYLSFEDINAAKYVNIYFIFQTRVMQHTIPSSGYGSDLRVPRIKILHRFTIYYACHTSPIDHMCYGNKQVQSAVRVI